MSRTSLHPVLSLALPLGLLSAMATGCASTSESAGANQLATNVGLYSPPPPGLVRPSIGIPPMPVGGPNSAGMEILASDQLSTLMVRTDRFNVIERGQLEALLNEQDLEGIVAQDQLARQAEVRGVDYLLLGKVTNLRTKAEKTSHNSGFGKVLSFATDTFSGGVGGLDIDSEKVAMKVECGVDLRLVDPSTGAVLDASFSEYTRTDKASSFGIQVLGVGSDANAEIEMSDDDRGLVLRLAFDDAIRKMLPSLDRKLIARSRDAAASSVTRQAAPVAEQVNEAGKATFCTGCGAKVTGESAFCGGCGAKFEG